MARSEIEEIRLESGSGSGGGGDGGVGRRQQPPFPPVNGRSSITASLLLLPPFSKIGQGQGRTEQIGLRSPASTPPPPPLGSPLGGGRQPPGSGRPHPAPPQSLFPRVWGQSMSSTWGRTSTQGVLPSRRAPTLRTPHSAQPQAPQRSRRWQTRPRTDARGCWVQEAGVGGARRGVDPRGLST